MEHKLILDLCIGLSLALVLGFITQRLRLSPILGYLLAGVAVGPHSPGFEADQKTASQFAEIGIILLMFGVGVNFHLKDLLAVRAVAVPGALGQSLVATLFCAIVAVVFGYPLSSGLVLGMAVSVASTVVLLRVLMDGGALDTPSGRVAVGWLVVEDIFTVFALVLLPPLADVLKAGAGGMAGIPTAVGLTVLKIAALGALILFVGGRVIPWILLVVARSRSRELFTLTVLVLALAIAVGSKELLGVSPELGAFLAGMVVGQSPLSHQAASDALPLRDAFAVLFFVSVGMLFDPRGLADEPFFFFSVLGVVIAAKPLAALVLVSVLGYSVHTGLTVAIGLAQIGEFTFILADVARDVKLIPEDWRSVVVACAVISIALNPLLFRSRGRIEEWISRRPALWRLLSRRSEARGRRVTERTAQTLARDETKVQAVVVGYGPVGRTVRRILDDFGIKTVIIDLNVDTVRNLEKAKALAVYGDARRRDILEAARVQDARYLLITLPDVPTRLPVIAAARELNRDLRIFVRARYLAEQAHLDSQGATAVCYEEAEAAVALAQLLLGEVGAAPERIREEAERIRGELSGRSPVTGARS